MEDEDETVTIQGMSDHPDLTVVPAQLKITNDDTSAIRGTPTSLTIREGKREHYRIALATEPTSDVVVTIDVPPNAGFTVNPGSLTFTPHSWGRKYVFVTGTQDDDSDDEAAAQITHSISSTDTAYRDLSADGVSVTIRDDDDPLVEVSFEDSTYTVTEGETVNVTLTLSVDPERQVTIPVTATGQDGASAADYSGAPVSVTFASGETEQTLTFSATQDTDNDDGESVKLGFGNLPDRVSAGTTSEATVNITDDDTPEVKVSFSSPAYNASEGGSVEVAVSLDADPERTVTIPIEATEQDGATASDYNVPNSVVFNSGDTEKTLSFQATQDSVDDDGESVKLGFGSSLPSRVTAGTPAEATVSITDDDVPSVTVSFEQPSYTVGEGNSVMVKVTLSADPERTVEVPISTTDMDGASSSDYSIVPQTVVFNSGDTEMTFSFSATDDTENDDGERVRLTFGALPARVSSTSPSQAIVSITDDDVPSITVNFEQPSYTVDEGDSATVKVILSARPERPVDIPVNATYLHGVGPTDFSGAPTTLNFAANDTEKTLTFQATDDSVDDDGEKVRLGFVNLPTGVAKGSTDETTVSITDDDHPQVTVSFEQSSYTVSEGSSETVKIILSADPERTVTIPLARTNQGGATAADYSVPTSVVFNSGDTEKTLSFQATQDTVDDDGESVKLAFGSSLPTRITEGTPAEATVSITDDDVPTVTVSFEQPSYTVDEGNSVMVKVTLSADPERTVTIPLLKVNQGGASSADYSGAPPSVIFSSGDTEKTFAFEATNDTANDDGESVRVSFGTLPDQVSAGTNSGTTISITDDDVPSITVSFEQPSYAVDEGSTVAVKVVLSADPERTVSIPLTKTNEGGATASDYNVPNSVVFNSGDTEKTLSFQATQDSVDDDGESVKLGFGSSLPTRITEGTPAEATVSITDDDVPTVTVSFEQPSCTVGEGNTVEVKVTLSADPERTVTIPLLKVNQGGASSADYSGVPPSVVFNSGDTEKTFAFEATDDTANDDGESVRLSFGTLPDQVSAGTNSGTTISITDDDVPSITVSFEQPSYAVDEGSTVAVKVVLSADPERTVSIPLTKTNEGGATASDYNVPNSVVFNSGDTEKTFAFEATNDTANDDGESVKLGFGSSLPTGVAKGSTDETTVSITDDDHPQVTVSFEQSSYTVSEGSSETVKVILSADPERTVTIPLTRTNQGGATASDYNVPNSVVFSSGDTEKTVSFQATQDTVDHDGESVKLGFGSSLPSRVTAGTPAETTVSITDDDVPSVTVSFEHAAYEVMESDDTSTTNEEENKASVKVTLSADPERTVVIPIVKTNQDGATEGDYTGVPSGLTFNSGETEKTFVFSATHDEEDDNGESVKLTFDTLPAGVSAGSISETVVSIIDDDGGRVGTNKEIVGEGEPDIAVSFEEASYTAREGGTVTVKVILSAAPQADFSLPLTATAGTGLTNSDYSGVLASLDFETGDTEKSFVITAIQDGDDESDEKLTLGFGTLLTGLTDGANTQAEVTIADSIHVSFGASSYEAYEGNDGALVTVELDSPALIETVIPIVATGMNGATSADWTGVPPK